MTAVVFVDSPAEIGARVRALRKERGLQGQELAKLIGVSGATLSRVECGHRALSGELASRICAGLGIDIPDIGPTTEDAQSAAPYGEGRTPELFQFNSRDVRVVELDGRRWAVAADVCAVLGLSDANQATSRLERDDVVKLRRSGAPSTAHTFWKQVDPRIHELLLVSEDGAVDLTLESRKPNARALRKWLIRDVFRSIRETGSYAAEPRDELMLLRDAVDHLIVTRRTAEEAQALARRTAERLERAEAERLSAAQATSDRLDRAQQAHGELSTQVAALAGERERDWFSSLGYARLHNLPLPPNDVQALGQYARSVGRTHGIAPGKVTDPRYGTVNTWPEWVLDDALIRLRERRTADSAG